MHAILQKIFPEGNKWFYYLAIPWTLAIAIFLVSFPALLVAAGYRYEEVTGITVDFGNSYIDMAAQLYDVAFLSWRIFIAFVVISCFFDMYYMFQRKRKEDGYL